MGARPGLCLCVCSPEERLFPLAGNALGGGSRYDDGRAGADWAESSSSAVAAATAATTDFLVLSRVTTIVISSITVILLRALLLGRNRRATARCIFGGLTAKAKKRKTLVGVRQEEKTSCMDACGPDRAVYVSNKYMLARLSPSWRLLKGRAFSF